MKKKYTMPGVIKVELKPEQAVLGQCSSGETEMRDSSSGGCIEGCKQRFSRQGVSYGITS